MKAVEHLYAVQVYTLDRWRTVFVSSFEADGEDAYKVALRLSTAPVRLVDFSVDGVDFIPTFARNYRVLDQRI